MQMDIKRFILIVVFGFSVIMLWKNWTIYSTPVQVAVPSASASAAQNSGLPAPVSANAATVSPAAPVAQEGSSIAASVASYARAAKLVVKTETMLVTVSAQGGDIIGVELLKHWKDEKKEQHFVMFQTEGDHFYVARSGLIGEGLPSHKTVFTLKPLVVENGNQVLRMTAVGANGATVTKTLIFAPDSYEIDVSYAIDNTSASPLSTSAYFELVRDNKPVEHKKGFFGGASTYTGPAMFTDSGKFQKVEFKEIAENKAKFVSNADDGWVAMVQHFFVSAFLPVKGPHEFFMSEVDKQDALYGAGVRFKVDVAAGKSTTFAVPLYVGPQEQKKLEAVASNFNRVVDYGWTTIIAEPLFWVLSKIHALIGNWGWSILMVTLLIKLAFFPLSAASYKSMAKMKKLMPRMKTLQERYANDKVKLNQAMMEMYKTEKVNPMGGCLPILIQMPVFMSLYYVLQSVVEMRQAPWLGWIQDLSSPDPYFILPLIMGATMLIQTKLNPAPADPMQAKVMMFMPIMFTAMFLFFPSGLVLYWVLNNVLSITQQWYITRMIENGPGKAA
jgi:YidC/Oxa1 family membrane protein insertase